MNRSFTLITLYIIAFAGFTSFSWMFPVVPHYTSRLGLSLADTGLIVSIYPYVNAAGIIPVGLLSDRWGRRVMLITGLVLAAVAPFLYPFARTFWSLCAVRVLHGLSAALFTPTALTIVTDITAEGEHGKAMGWYTASSQLGLMAGPLAGGFILEHFGFEAAFLSCSIVPLMALIFAFTRIKALSYMLPEKPGAEAHPWRWLSERGAAISFVALVMIAIGSSSVSTFIPLYAGQFDIKAAGAGLIITACYLSSAAMRIPAGNMADRLGNAPMILTGMLLCAVGIGLIPAFHSLLALSLVALIFGLGMGFSMPAALSWLAIISPPHKRGFIMGLGSAAFQAGLAIGATMLGLVVQSAGFTVMYLTAGLAILAGTFAVIMLLHIGTAHKGRA